jgi:hypothetical protein
VILIADLQRRRQQKVDVMVDGADGPVGGVGTRENAKGST